MTDHRKRENISKSETCHVLLALKRKKDNEGDMGGRTIMRQIVRDLPKDLKILIAKCEKLGGVWRIYHTVNSRSFTKANKLFQHRLIDDIDEYYYRIDSLWMNCLLKKESRAEKNFLIDWDSKQTDLIHNLINRFDIEVIKTTESPSGYHIITKPFDVNKIKSQYGLDDLDILKDGYYYMWGVGNLK